jgi:hypothetical protein
MIAARIEGRRPEKRGTAAYAAGIDAAYIKKSLIMDTCEI